MRRAVAGSVAALVLVAGCSGDDDEGYRLDDELRLNDIQVLGTHNSYHVQAEQPLWDLLHGFDAELGDSLEYTHEPLRQQLDEEGIRQFELDVFADPVGGLYADPKGPGLAGLSTPHDPAMDEPGFKVFHVQDIDFRSTCPTFVACLTELHDWSEAHPGHVPIMVLVEVKQDAIPDPANAGFAVPAPVGAAELDQLDAEIRSVFDEDRLITPDDVRGDHDSIEEAVRSDGWPTLGESRGRFLFALDNEDTVRDLYIEGHPALAGRVLFTSSPQGTPEAAFLKLNDAVGSEATIRQAVVDGYVVRTRADADTAEARTGDTTVRDAALRSGAQWVSTDYPVDDPRFAPDYSASIPGGEPARCNPVRNPEDCASTDVEDPELLAED